MFAYTDYPILGEYDYTVRKVELLAYDRNKYITVRHGDTVTDVKWGYIYTDETMSKVVSEKVVKSLPFEVGQAYPTRKQIQAEIKSRNRRKKTVYIVDVDEAVHDVDTLEKALRLFARIKKNGHLYASKKHKRGFDGVPMCGIENGSFFVYRGKRGASRHQVSQRQIKLLRKMGMK